MNKKKTFEDALKRLNEIVTELENGDIVLDDMVRLYEEGSDLIKYCLGKLDDVEKKISFLSGDSPENLKTEPFEE
jgi:exodeoxyribonuclease VII small subunit